MNQPQASAFRRLVKRLIVPELRQGLRAQFQFRLTKGGAKQAKLTKPLMTADERDLNDSWVRYLNLFVEMLERYAPEKIDGILEWGLGHSTSYLYELAQERSASVLLSIEHNERYHRAFSKKFPPASFFESRLETLMGYSPHQIRESGENYATCATTYDRTFDLIFIDGRRRNECLLVASELLSDDGVVILHDCLRTRYDVGCRLFDVVAQHDGTGGFRIMRKKQ